MFLGTKFISSSVQSACQSRSKSIAFSELRNSHMGGGALVQGDLLVPACNGQQKQKVQRNMCSSAKFLPNKNVIFVGGLGCIGKDTSKEICKAGPKNLILLDRLPEPEKNVAELSKVNPKTKVSFYEYDVTIPVGESCQLLKKIFDKFKTIDLLINGAGILDDHAIEKTIAVNFTGLVNTTTAMMPFWDTRNGGPGGVMANICSVTGMNAIYQVPVYSASKAAVFNFTNSLAKLAPITGVTCYSINPGITRTSLVKKFNSWLDVEPKVAELLLGHPTQSTQECAKSFVRAIEQNINGAIWKLDLACLKMVDWPVHWDSKI